MVFNQKEFNEFVLDTERVTFSPEYFKLASGKESRFYVNWRKKVNGKLGITSGKNANIAADYLLDFLEDKGLSDIDTFIGVPEAMTMFAGIVQIKDAQRKGLEDYPLVALRKNPKNHGDSADKYFIGEPQGKVCVLEDITTTAKSLIKKGIKPIQDAGYDVVAAVTLVNRCAKKGEVEKLVFEKTGVDYYTMAHVFELLPQAYKKFTNKLKSDLIKEMQPYGNLKL